MNQILANHKFKKNIKKRYKFQFIISISFFIIFFIYLLLYYSNLNYNEKYSSHLLNLFSIENLYNDSDYTSIRLNNNTSAYILCVIEIPKIKIKYPVLSTISDELLKISPCRFYGPEPNKIGNLCIAAHNYNDDRFFGHLYELDINDTIYIYTSNMNYKKYEIYAKYEIESTDTSCTSQHTNGTREITLVTCNNFNKKRLIIKAIEK